MPSEIALQGGTLESKIAYRRVDPDFEKIFSAHNDQVDMNRGKKVVFRKTLKTFCLRKFLVRVILDTTYVPPVS